MAKQTASRTLQGFLSSDFSRVSSAVAKEICEKAGVSIDAKPQELMHQDIDKIFQAIKQVKIMSPPTNCLSPIGEETLIKGLKKEINAEFFAATTRPHQFTGACLSRLNVL